MKSLLKMCVFVFVFAGVNCAFCTHKNIAELTLPGSLEKKEANVKWNESELKERVNEIYDYALDEMDKMCQLPGYSKIILSDTSKKCGFGTLTHLVRGYKEDYSKGESDMDRALLEFNTNLEKLICGEDETRFTEQFDKSPFMRFLIREGCFYWKEGSNGNMYLLPQGVPSKRKLKALYAEFKRITEFSEEEDIVEEFLSNYGPYDGKAC